MAYQGAVMIDTVRQEVTKLSVAQWTHYENILAIGY